MWSYTVTETKIYQGRLEFRVKYENDLALDQTFYEVISTNSTQDDAWFYNQVGKKLKMLEELTIYAETVKTKFVVDQPIKSDDVEMVNGKFELKPTALDNPVVKPPITKPFEMPEF